MIDIIANVWFFVVFIPSVYLAYQCLQCFDYTKILRNGKSRELLILLMILSVIIAFLFASTFSSIIERIIEMTKK